MNNSSMSDSNNSHTSAANSSGSNNTYTRRYNQNPTLNNIAATITTYDDIQYDDDGKFIKVNETAAIDLIPSKNKFIIKSKYLGKERKI